MKNQMKVLQMKLELLMETLYLLQEKEPNYIRAVFPEKIVREIQEVLALAQNIEEREKVS